MFNPRPRVQHVALPQGREAWVVDDALLDPHALRQMAQQQRARFEASPHNAYPGIEWRMGPEVSEPLAEFFMLHLRSLMGARRTLSMCHRDRFGTGPQEQVAACTLYLFDDPALGGTGFYAPRRPVEHINADIRRWATMERSTFDAEIGAAPGYLAGSNAHFELLGVVPAAFNRAVFYDGSGFHSSHITEPQRLREDPASGRLTLNGFFVCRRSAA
jgi:hypothetical protein